MAASAPIPSTGAWSYALNNTATNVQALAQGQTVTDTLTVASLDGTASRAITVSIAGSNNGDVLDLRAALLGTNWNHLPSTLGTYLKVTNSGGDTNLAIVPRGSSTATAIATLTGTNYGLADLVSHHSILT